MIMIGDHLGSVNDHVAQFFKICDHAISKMILKWLSLNTAFILIGKWPQCVIIMAHEKNDRCHLCSMQKKTYGSAKIFEGVKKDIM